MHVITGYLLTGGLCTRVLWGLFGPARARWSDFWHPQVWLGVLRERRLPAGHGFGHDPLASLAYIVAYGVMVLMVATGLGLAAAQFDPGAAQVAEFGDGPEIAQIAKFEVHHKSGECVAALFDLRTAAPRSAGMRVWRRGLRRRSELRDARADS